MLVEVPQTPVVCSYRFPTHSDEQSTARTRGQARVVGVPIEAGEGEGRIVGAVGEGARYFGLCILQGQR